MKTGIMVAMAYWAAVAAGGVIGWAGFLAAAAAWAWIAERKAVRS